MKKKTLIISIVAFILLSVIGVFLYFTVEDKTTSLNVIEKKWIDNNKKVLQDISLYTNVPVFSYNGEGYVFDFLSSLEGVTGLEFNKISYVIGNNVKTDYAFMQKNNLESSDILMYTDNYVLVTSSVKLYNKPSEIKNITVGVINNTVDLVSGYLLGSDVTYKTFTDYNTMTSSLGRDVDAIVIPRIQYLNTILDNENYTIAYNINEYKIYYVLHLGNNETLNNILTKYYQKWSSDNGEKAFDSHLLTSYFQASKDSSKNIAKLRSKRYTYGFIANAPYDMMNDNDLVGINNDVIASFAKMSGATIEYKEFNDSKSLIDAFNSNNIDFYFNSNGDTTYDVDVFNTVSPFTEELVVLTKNSNNMVVNSINSLKGYKVGVLKNSRLESYLTNYNIDVVAYNSMSSLMKDSKIAIKVIDSYNYDYYVVKGIKGYHKSYVTRLANDYTYTFRSVSDNKDFINLFNFYLTFTETQLHINSGLAHALNTNSFVIFLKYMGIILSFVLIIGVALFIVFKMKNNKNAKVNLSKEDKLKYIDMLTSLKNRNYLNDNIELWESRDVYPQAVIIVDLNNIAYINDNYGHAEGDAVINEAANILIKNQNPNSEIIRTSGNEFLIYMVSYDEKQVIAYIKKLKKELKEISHGFGAAVGYSIIADAIKTVDDAINEATIDMRNDKEESSKD